jgi:hypothetical protein
VDDDGNPPSKKLTRAIGLMPGALCGSYACNGCYQVDDGDYIHPPRPGYRQKDLIDLDRQEEAE